MGSTSNLKVRNLRAILAAGNPNEVEEIELRRWVREYPQSRLTEQLREKFPFLAEQKKVGDPLRHTG